MFRPPSLPDAILRRLSFPLRSWHRRLEKINNAPSAPFQLPGGFARACRLARGRHPVVRSACPSAGPQGPRGRSVFRTESPVAAVLRRKSGASRAATRAPGCGGGGRTTAAVIPCRGPDRPATALTFCPQAAERRRRHEAEPQARSRRGHGVSPCGKRCRIGCRLAAERRAALPGGAAPRGEDPPVMRFQAGDATVPAGPAPTLGWNLRKSRLRRGNFAVFRTRAQEFPHSRKLPASQDVTNGARGSKSRTRWRPERRCRFRKLRKQGPERRFSGVAEAATRAASSASEGADSASMQIRNLMLNLHG